MVSLRQFAFTLSDIGAGAFNHPARLFQRQHVGTASHQLLFHKGIGLLIVFQRFFGNRQLGGQPTLIEIGLGDIGHHHDLRRTLRRLAGEEILPVRLAHIFQLAEKVEFIAKIQPHFVAFAGGLLPLKIPFVVCARAAISLRITPGIGHVILRTRGFNVQHRHA